MFYKGCSTQKVLHKKVLPGMLYLERSAEDVLREMFSGGCSLGDVFWGMFYTGISYGGCSTEDVLPVISYQRVSYEGFPTRDFLREMFYRGFLTEDVLSKMSTGLGSKSRNY